METDRLGFVCFRFLIHHILKDPVMACLDAVTMRLAGVDLESPGFALSLRKSVGLGIPRYPPLLSPDSLCTLHPESCPVVPGNSLLSA